MSNNFSFQLKPVSAGSGKPLVDGAGDDNGRLPEDCLSVSGTTVTAYIKKPGQGIPYGFMLNPSGWEENWEDGFCGQHKWSTNNGPCVEIATYAYVSGDMLHIATKWGAISVIYSSDDDNDLPPPIVGFLRILIPEASAGNYSGIYITAGGTKIYLKCAGSDPYPYFPTTDIGFSSEEMEIDLSTCGLNVGDTITDIRIHATGKMLTFPAYQASTITIGYMIFSAVSLYE